VGFFFVCKPRFVFVFFGDTLDISDVSGGN